MGVLGEMSILGVLGENALYVKWRTADPVTFPSHSLHREPGNAGRSHVTQYTQYTHSQPFTGTCLIPHQRVPHREPPLTDYLPSGAGIEDRAGRMITDR